MASGYFLLFVCLHDFICTKTLKLTSSTREVALFLYVVGNVFELIGGT